MTTLEARARERGDATSTSFDGDEMAPRDGGAREVDREPWVARVRERLRDGAGGTRAGRRRRRRGAWTRARAVGGVVVGAWAVRGVDIADGASVLTKGVARNGFVSASAYKYYKVNVACVESAQPLTLELTTSNGNADLYVSRTSQPSTGSYQHRSMNTGNALDSVTISSPTNGYYYVSVFGTLSSTYKIRARTTMFTGKHPCTGFRITDSDVSSVGSGSGNAFILQDALTVSAAAGFTADLSVDGNVILGNAYADSVTVKGEMKLGVTDSTSYSITRQPPSSPSSNPGGALSVIGASATNQGGSVTVLGGTGGTGAGGAVTVEAGAATSGNGGALTLRGGTSNSGTGGDVVIDAGDSTTKASTYEGVIHIGPNAASYVRVGKSSNKQVQTDIFGDLTVHGNLITTNDLVFRNSYTSYVQISTTQDGTFHQELRAPKLTGLDAEDITGTPTSSLTIDAGEGGSQKHVIIAPTEAAAVYIGSTSANVPISLRQGGSTTDYRLYADSNGKLTLTSDSNQDVSVTAGGTGSITLTPGDDFTVDAGDDVSIDAAGSLFLKQGSTNILSWNDAGAVTVSAKSGQDLTMSGDDVVLQSEASSTLALKQDSTNILSWDASGAVTMRSVAGQALSATSHAVSSGTGGAVSISGGASTTSDTGVGGALTLSGGAGGSASGGAGGAVTVSSGAAHTSGAVTISSGAGATTNGGIVVDAKTGTGSAGAITVRQGSSSGDRLVVSSAGAVSLDTASGEDLTLKTGGTARVTVDSSGNVGVGTATPSSIFTANGGGLWDGSDHTSKVCATLQVGRGAGVGDPTRDEGTGAILEFRHHSDYRYVTIESVSERQYSEDIGLRFKTVDENTGPVERMRIDAHGKVGIGTSSPSYALEVSGSAHVSGALSKGSGSFMIDHPLPEMKETHNLYHSFIEGPRADLIYRGTARLTNGRAVVDLDEVSDMTSGTFTALNRDVQCFTSNESDWDAVRGSINGATLTIRSQNSASTAVVSWLVIGERQDEHMYETEWTDENGRVAPEQLKKNATA